MLIRSSGLWLGRTPAGQESFPLVPWLLPGRSWVDPNPGPSHGGSVFRKYQGKGGGEVAERQGELGLGPGCRVGPGRMGARGVSGSLRGPGHIPPFKET